MIFGQIACNANNEDHTRAVAAVTHKPLPDLTRNYLHKDPTICGREPLSLIIDHFMCHYKKASSWHAVVHMAMSRRLKTESMPCQHSANGDDVLKVTLIAWSDEVMNGLHE